MSNYQCMKNLNIGNSILSLYMVTFISHTATFCGCHIF